MRNAYRPREIGHLSDQSGDLRRRLIHCGDQRIILNMLDKEKNIWFNILFHKNTEI